MHPDEIERAVLTVICWITSELRSPHFSYAASCSIASADASAIPLVALRSTTHKLAAAVHMASDYRGHDALHVAYQLAPKRTHRC